MDCSLNGATGANSTLLLVIAAVVLCCGAVSVVMGRRKAPALAAMVLALVAVGVGGTAGRADAAAASCIPLCLDIQNPEAPDEPDSLIDSTDGVHLTITAMASTDGSCTGGLAGPGGYGAIADTQQEALDICGTPQVMNLNQIVVGLGYITPVPPTNWWGCVGIVITPGP